MIDIRESMLSRTGSDGPNANYTLEYRVWHTEDEDAKAILEAVRAVAPLEMTMGIIPADPNVPESIDEDIVVRQESATVGNVLTIQIRNNVRQYLRPVTLTYSRIPPPVVEDAPPSYSFTITAQQVNRTTALSDPDPDPEGGVPTYRQKAYDRTGTAINDPFSGAIGVSGEGVNIRTEGVSVFTPTFSYTETKRFRAADVRQPAFQNKLLGYVGCVNSRSFGGYSAGEVLLVGVNGSQETADPTSNWILNYQYQVSRNQDTMDVGGITVTDVRGWDYVWAYYGDEADPTTGLIWRATYAFVAQVYRARNLNNIYPGEEVVPEP